MDSSSKTGVDSPGRRQQAQRQQGTTDPAIPRSSSGMQMSENAPKHQDTDNPFNCVLDGTDSASSLELPLSMVHKIRSDDNGSNEHKLRSYPVLAGIQAASVSSTPMGSETATISDDSQAEGALHPFPVSTAPATTYMKQQQQHHQQQQQSRTAGCDSITAPSLPYKVFNGEAWLLDPYGTGNNPLLSTTTKSPEVGRDTGTPEKQHSAAVMVPSGSGGGDDDSSGGMLDEYGETDTSHAGRASLASDGDIELPAKHELVHDRLGSPGSDDLGI